jgi:predicted secreted protein
MHRIIKLTLGALLGLATVAWAQTPTAPATPVTNMNLMAQAAAEVENDEMTVYLSARKEGPNAKEISQSVLASVQRALAAARRTEGVTARLNNANTSPIWVNKGRLDNWTAYASLVLTSRNFAALSKLAADLTSDMQVERVTFALSRQERAQTEERLMTELAVNFREKADSATRAFGFKSYDIKSLSLSQNFGAIPQPYPMAIARAAGAAADNGMIPIPSEGGKTTVLTTVNGVIEMRR